ncbi:MAG: phosphoesterase PA-phosphatase related protein [Thermoleophilia bacterium]|nr:phosphoesterase PA-phosphatase related protein [Thermoleophilia bacterium]
MQRLLRQPRTFGVLVWTIAFSASVVTVGLPTKRMNVLVWVTLAILALGIERPRATLRSFATTWVPLFGALVAYDHLRGASDGAQSTAHTWPQLDLDLWLGGGRTPSERLQDAFWHPGSPSWWDYVAWAVYQSHFLVPLLLAVVLWAMRHRFATRYAIALAAVSWLSLATYWLYPAQPPWMTARDGIGGDIDRVVQRMWADVGIDRAAKVYATNRSAGRYSNQIAALPSMHAAFPMLITTILWGTRRWLDALLVTYVLTMALTLVYAGEHFTFDIVLGWAYALGIALVARRYQVGRLNRSSVALEPQAAADGRGGIERVEAGALRSRYTGLPQTDETRS